MVTAVQMYVADDRIKSHPARMAYRAKPFNYAHLRRRDTRVDIYQRDGATAPTPTRP